MEELQTIEEKPSFDIDLWINTREEFKTKVGSIMVEGFDYHVIKNKKSLSKGGAEKIASIFGWVAKFGKDTETLEMLGNQTGLVAYVCNLTKGINEVGQGRGASVLDGDPNKTIKMAQKSAFIDAVLRASGLSDIYTQDLEDMPADQIDQPQGFTKQATQIPSSAQPSDKQIGLIKKLMEQKGYIEPDLIEKGFTEISALTGGKGGTASELIDWLLKAERKDVNQERNFDDIPWPQTE